VSRAVRLLLMVAAAVVVVVVLFTIVFPWVDRQFFANPVLG
jgi:hypothetical protein